MSTQIVSSIFQKKTESLIIQNPGSQSGYITSAGESGNVSSQSVQPSLDGSRPDAPVVSATPGETALKVRDPFGGKEPLTFVNYKISQVFSNSDSGKLVIQGFDPNTEFITADAINIGSRNACPVVVSMQRYAKQSTGVVSDLTLNPNGSNAPTTKNEYEQFTDKVKVENDPSIEARMDRFLNPRNPIKEFFDRPNAIEEYIRSLNRTGTSRVPSYTVPISVPRFPAPPPALPNPLGLPNPFRTPNFVGS